MYFVWATYDKTVRLHIFASSDFKCNVININYYYQEVYLHQIHIRVRGLHGVLFVAVGQLLRHLRVLHKVKLR